MSKRCKPCNRLPLVRRFKNRDNDKIESLFNAACDFFGVDTEKVKSSDRHRGIVEQRHLTMYALLLKGFSSVHIGKLFNRNHASVLHAKESVQNNCFTDPDYKKRFINLRDYLINYSQSVN